MKISCSLSGFRPVLLLLCSLFLTACPNGNEPDPDMEKPVWGTQPPLPKVSGEASFTLSATQNAVNVMEKVMPRMPVFPVLQAKEGKLTGFVADLSGKPLEDAYIGVRSTLIGGAYSSASATTDANGYYEILIPTGAADIYAAGYSISYGGGKAAIGLYPADGKLGVFESTKGLVENFVLLSYGLADAGDWQSKPSSSSGYFGGTLYINYPVAESDDPWAAPSSLPEGADIEIKLTPAGEMLYGENKTFIITKKADTQNRNFYINNIPVGLYTISAKLSDGRQLKLMELGNANAFGLDPKEALSQAKVRFMPVDTKPNMVLPNYGSWNEVNIRLELP